MELLKDIAMRVTIGVIVSVLVILILQRFNLLQFYSAPQQQPAQQPGYNPAPTPAAYPSYNFM